MENQETSQNNKPLVIEGEPLPIERHEKLKVFATASIHTEVPQSFLDEKKISLSLVIAYNKPDADTSINNRLVSLGHAAEDYKRQLQLSMEVEKVIALSSPILRGIKISGSSENEKIKDIVKEAEDIIKKISEVKPIEISERTKKKSLNELIAHVMYVFDKVGTLAEKEIAQKVIAKFKKQLAKK